MTASLVAWMLACSSSSSPGTSGTTDPTEGAPSGSMGGAGSNGASAPSGPSGAGGPSAPSAPASTLACNAVSWCTTWSNSSATSTPVANPPALTGGAIADGLYRLAQSDSTYSDALLFQGGAVLHVETHSSNSLGTYAVDGAKLTLTYKTSCNVDGETAFPGMPSAYEFKATPTELYLAWIDSTGKTSSSVDRWVKVNTAALCQETDSFSCHVSNCKCAVTEGKALEKCSD